MTSANSPSPSLCFSIWEMDLGVSWVQTHEGSVKTGTCHGLTPQARGKQRPGGTQSFQIAGIWKPDWCLLLLLSLMRHELEFPR